jgi:hypothetical protein
VDPLGFNSVEQTGDVYLAAAPEKADQNITGIASKALNVRLAMMRHALLSLKPQGT